MPITVEQLRERIRLESVNRSLSRSTPHIMKIWEHPVLIMTELDTSAFRQGMLQQNNLERQKVWIAITEHDSKTIWRQTQKRERLPCHTVGCGSVLCANCLIGYAKQFRMASCWLKAFVTDVLLSGVMPKKAIAQKWSHIAFGSNYNQQPKEESLTGTEKHYALSLLVRIFFFFCFRNAEMEAFPEL